MARFIRRHLCRPVPCTSVWLALVAVGVGVGGSVLAEEGLSPSYRSLVLRYEAGEHHAAVTELLDWNHRRLREAARALDRLHEAARLCREEEACPQRLEWLALPVRAALLLHTDTALRQRSTGRPPLLHETAAAELASLMSDDPALRAFAERWWVAMTALALAEGRADDASYWAERGVREYPRSSHLLVLLANSEEIRAGRVTPARGATPGQIVAAETAAEGEARGRCESARVLLRRATAMDPALAEAHLHLGRVAWRLGEPAEALAELETALSVAGTGPTAFLAELFLGRIQEEAGRPDDARRRYAAAIAIKPDCQSARIALALLLHGQGDSAGARREIEHALGDAGRRTTDPLWIYDHPLRSWLDGAHERLDALRREASR
jgi:tetratricopeptide (TPR) repeat protein